MLLWIDRYVLKSETILLCFFQEIVNMTHQPNKQFNTYKEGLELEVLREYCMEHGVVYDK